MTVKLALLEMCVVCDFVHRNGPSRPTTASPHFHWGDEATEVAVRGYRVHRTVCASHFPEHLFRAGRAMLSPRYAVEGSLNAPLPTDRVSDEQMWALERCYSALCLKLHDGSIPTWVGPFSEVED